MVERERWLEIPLLFEHQKHVEITAVFSAHGVAYRSDAVLTSLDRWGGKYAYAVYVRADHAQLAARILRANLGLDDPRTDRPLVGKCPACGAEVNGEWTCPSCEISFRSRHDPDDPLIEFVRTHGGFDR